MSSREETMKQVIRKKHPSTLRSFIYPVARWCPWGKWNADGSILLNPRGEAIYPLPPLELKNG